MSFGLLGRGAGAAARCEFVRMKGPGGKGHAEVAVSRPRTPGVHTPNSEPGLAASELWDSDWEDDPDDLFLYRHQRRLSDPSANITTFVRGGWRARERHQDKSRSENEGLDVLGDGEAEVEAGDLRDELDDGAYNPLWAMRGFTQTFHLWKEGRRAQSAPLNAFLTYVTLPWWSIAKDILDHREEPILTF